MAQSLSDIRTAKWLRGEDVSTDENWADLTDEDDPEEPEDVETNDEM